MRRLAQAGFTRDFTRRALLPDWWEAGCDDEQALLPDLEIRIARFLGLNIATVREPGIALAVPSYPGAQLRRVHDIDRDRLGPAIHTATQIAATVLRNIQVDMPPVQLPPADGLLWRDQIKHTGSIIGLDDVLVDLWQRGIPVVALDFLPAPSFQGMACIVENRPVIIVGHKHDEPGRLAYLIAHEAGHIATGDCTPDHPVVDEEDDLTDDAAIERTAELYATRLLVGGDRILRVSAENYRDLATKASEAERNSGVDAGMVIFAWARETGNYATATRALGALYRASGARRLLREHFIRHVDIDSASESDRALLRCVCGGAEHDATAC